MIAVISVSGRMDERGFGCMNTLNLQELDALLRSGESYTLEFKAHPDKSLASEVSAFANASGGRVVIGVTDQGVAVGTDTSNAARSRVQDTLNTIEPRLQTTLSVVGNLIVVTVPEGGKKPYSCPQGFYLRSGPNAQKMKRDDIVDFLHAEGRFRYDAVAREELPVADNFNADTFQDFLAKANITGILSRDTLLINLGCAKLAGGKLVYTTRAGCFFGITSTTPPTFRQKSFARSIKATIKSSFSTCRNCTAASWKTSNAP
jgi:ATP-dependent DNA helicase RecG